MMRADCGLIIFLRIPEKGKVKTRIAKSLGDDTALQIYEELTSITLKLIPDLPMQTYLFYEGGLPEPANRIPVAHYLEQSAGTLGEKILAAIEHILLVHRKAIIIGSDCPYLMTTDIIEAMEMLESTDTVIGPSRDGGYYLLGCKKVIPELFSGIPWSTDVVLSQTRQKMDALQITSHQLRTLDDIDVEADWLQYKSHVVKTPLAPAV